MSFLVRGCLSLLVTSAMACSIDIPAQTARATTTDGNEAAAEGSATASALAANWTLLFYGKTDAAHQSALEADFGAIGSAPAGVNVVVTTDGSDFGTAVGQAFGSYPAKHRAVVIWSRAGDATAEARDGLDGIEQLDLLGFDTASAPRLESAFALRDLAKVYVASSSSDGSPAWAYSEILASLGDSGGELAHREDLAWTAHPSMLPRLHVAVDTAGLDTMSRAAASFVQAVASNPDALVDVGASAAEQAVASPSFAAFVNAMTLRPNRGVVTAAAANAAEHLAAAAITGSTDIRDLAVALPPASAVTPEWLASYSSAAADWNRATKWSELIASFAHYGAGRPGPSFTASVVTDEGLELPAVTTPGGGMAYVRVAATNNDVAFVHAKLVSVSIGEAPTTYGEIGSSTSGTIPWTRRVATITGQDATSIVWRTTGGLMGRIEVGGQTIAAAALAATVFVLHPDDGGEAVTAAELLARDPVATFTPALIRGTNELPVFGSRIALADVAIGSRPLGAGAYEVRVEGEGPWGERSTVKRAFRVEGL